MDLEKILELQYEFDREYFPELIAENISEKERLIVFSYLVLCTFGELGELASIVKKVQRRNISLTDVRAQVSDEVADVFIYLIKICQHMQIDLEKAFLTKLDFNKVKYSNKGT